VVPELARPVVRNTGISVSYADGRNRAGLFEIRGQVTGGVLPLRSVLVAAPIVFAADLLDTPVTA